MWIEPESFISPESMGDVAPKTVRLTPLGGLGEIGMNCMAIETDQDLIVVDCGKLFSDLSGFGVDYLIPDFRYILARRQKLRALVVTHGHEDHVGGIAFAVSQGVNCPIYATPFTRRLIEERLIQARQKDKIGLLKSFSIGEVLKIGDFTIGTYSVAHSLVDCSGLIINTPIGRIVQTGDWREDPAPYYPQSVDWKILEQAGKDGTLLLMSDSTNVESHSLSLSEEIVGVNLEANMAHDKGLVFVTMFASNLARMAQVFEAAEKLGKRVALCGRSMDLFFRLGGEFQYVQKGRGSWIGLEEISNYPREQVVVLCTGSQAEPRSALARIARDEYPWVRIRPGDRVLYSARVIPGNEKAITRLINDLLRRGGEVLYEPSYQIHASGHATRPELKQMIETVAPKFFLPIHGEYRHLVRHRMLALEAGIPEDRTIVAQNYDVIELTPDELKIVAALKTERVWIEGPVEAVVTRPTLKMRRAMGEKGLLTVAFSWIKKHQEPVLPPRIVQHGICDGKEETDLKHSIADIFIRAMNRERSRKPVPTLAELEETLRVELRRYLAMQTGRKIPVSVLGIPV